VKNRPRVAAIMGGHDEVRGTDVYRAVAQIAAALSNEKFLVASGGGPGAIKAAHLGARFAVNADGLKFTIDQLKAAAASLPAHAADVIGKDAPRRRNEAQFSRISLRGYSREGFANE
jgi:predicted Rossmann-fold nucleotide-binding protein